MDGTQVDALNSNFSNNVFKIESCFVCERVH